MGFHPFLETHPECQLTLVYDIKLVIQGMLVNEISAMKKGILCLQ
jgi:hypothetical protein